MLLFLMASKARVTHVLSILGAFAKLRKVTVSFIMSVGLSVCLSVCSPVRPSARHNSAHTGRIFMKLYI